jgi:dephospho-CoA kinase
VESAILYEAGLDSLCAKVVYIDAPVEVRVTRTVARDHSDVGQVLARIQAQQVRPHKNAIVLSNDGTLSISELTDSLLMAISH